MAVDADHDSLFQGCASDPDDDQDVYSLCTGLVADAVTLEGNMSKTHIPEPGAILIMIQDHMKIIEHEFGLWEPELKTVALGAMVLYKERFSTDAGIHDHVELLHALCHEKHIRAHGGCTHTKKDGVWQPHKGVPAEGLLFSVKNLLLSLEGLCTREASLVVTGAVSRVAPRPSRIFCPDFFLRTRVYTYAIYRRPKDPARLRSFRLPNTDCPSFPSGGRVSIGPFVCRHFE